MLKRKPSLFILGLALSLLTAGCNVSDVQSFFTSLRSTAQPERLALKIKSKRPHDTTAYTEGLLLRDGVLYESTGLNGQSSLRAEDPMTGKVLRRVNLSEQYFGEGLAL